jgi:type IV pilus biogenesis protein CpaD/CtpE
MTQPGSASRVPFICRAALFGVVLASVAACVSTTPVSPEFPAYVVFFTPFSADLDDGAKSVIADASRAAQAAASRRVVVAGYADRIGTPATNHTLTQLRAQVVADGLVADGVDRRRIVLQPKGSVGGDPGVESRRVMIELN